MNLLLQQTTGKLARLSEFFITLGPLGLFAVTLLDSSFVPMPGSADALMILLTTAHPRYMILYALLATAGSTTGCVILYYISRRAGSRALRRFSPAKQQRVKELIDRYDVLSVLVAALLPPPFPFKLFVITAGVFRFSLARFAVAIICGRLFRFLLEGYLAIRYGAQAREILARYYPWIGLGFAAAIIFFVLMRKLLKKKKADSRVDERTAEEV